MYYPSENGSKLGVAVPASEMGISDHQWVFGQELEAFLEQPFLLKKALDNPGSHMHGAQALILIHDVMTGCDPLAGLSVKEFPPDPSLASRERHLEQRPAFAVSDMISVAHARCYATNSTPVSSLLAPRMPALYCAACQSSCRLPRISLPHG